MARGCCCIGSGWSKVHSGGRQSFAALLMEWIGRVCMRTMLRGPALDLHALPVDDLTGDHGAAAALGAYLNRDAPSDAAWGDDPGELGDCRARSRSGPHGSDTSSTPAAEASAGRARGHVRVGARSSGATVDLWEEGRRKGAPEGVSPRVDFATSNSVGLFLPDPDFQHWSGSDPTASRGAYRRPRLSRRRD
jgi:hypothetical protein